METLKKQFEMMVLANNIGLAVYIDLVVGNDNKGKFRGYLGLDTLIKPIFKVVGQSTTIEFVLDEVWKITNNGGSMITIFVDKKGK